MKARQKVATLFAVAGLALGATACGGTDTTGSTTGNTRGGALEQIKSRGELRVGVKYDSPPFGSLNPATNAPEGFDIDVSRELAKHIVGSKEDLKFTNVSTATRIPLLQQGEIDLSVATITITNDRKAQVNFSTPYYPSGMAVLVPEGSPLAAAKDIAGKTNCTTTGSVAGDLVAKAAKDKYGIDEIKSIVLGTYPECVLALKQKRADFIGTDQGTLVGLAKQSKGVKLLPELMSNEPWGIAVKKGDTELLTAVNKALNDMFRDGTWTALYKKWVGDQPPAGWPPNA